MVIDTVGNINVHWINVHKGIHFFDTRTEFQPPSTNKNFQYAKFNPVKTSIFIVLA